MTVHPIPKEMLGLSRVAQIELETRHAENLARVDFIAVNDTYRIVAYDHAVIWRQKPDRITGISGGLAIDNNAPQIVWLGKLCRHLASNHQTGHPLPIEMKDLPDKFQIEFDLWCLGKVLWVPMIGAHKALEGGLLLFRDQRFSDPEQRILGRIANAYGHTCSALRAPVGQRTGTAHLTGRAKWAIAMAALFAVL